MSSKFLVIGLGSIGRKHFANLRTLRPEAQIAVLRRSGNLSYPNEEKMGPVFQTVEEGVRFEPDAVVVAGPATLHIEDAIPFIQMGVPVLIEKPLAASPKQLLKLNEIEPFDHSRVHVGYNLRFEPSLQKFQELILDQKFGRVLAVRAETGQYLPSWRKGGDYSKEVSARKDLGGGVLNELSHELDYLVYLFGRPSSIYGQGGKQSDLNLDVEDVVDLLMDFKHPDFSVSLGLDFLQPKATRTCKVICSSGTIIWNAMKQSVEVFSTSTGDREVFEFDQEHDRNAAYMMELEQFLSPRGGPSSVLCGLDSGAFIVRLVDLAKESMKQGKVILI